ncbi:response regulator [Flavobacterium coralii]|uniref:response regulator n=1 Tax=Flavobacterium coralii TaxID=2838017 RepID=UPI000C3B182B|nr:response regulator [Flavobacterium coralii]MBE99232.1 response regulator [Flavobacterium sp.]MBY8961908.1 response regulator [Flavobacterium coralii]|tara:strand:+ start:6638 stop:7084 length:447 start_codon:yes stop_codon:yes gene_type:complete
MRPSPLHILLADDDEDDRLFFKEAFEEVKVQHSITPFINGVKLMDYLNDQHNPLPDMIFLDLNMPMKSGMECLREIRKNKRLKNLSVAIYSTSSSDLDIEETFVAGANVYIKKPNDFGDLKKVLSHVVHINWQYILDGLNKDSFILSV